MPLAVCTCYACFGSTVEDIKRLPFSDTLISLLASSCTIWVKWSARSLSVVSLALPACTLSLILCRVGVPKKERGEEKTDICLTKLWELSPFIWSVTCAVSLCSLHLCELCVFRVWGGWKREESPGTMAWTLLCTSPFLSASSLLSISSSTCQFCCALLMSG